MGFTTWDVSVIVCAYTEARWDELVEGVESIRSQTVQPREIIVVIDHNEALLRRAKTGLAGVLVVENNQARGLGGARNTGATAAQGGVVAFIDDDALAAPDWLEQMMLTYADPDALGVGGSIEARVSCGRAEWFPSEFDWVVGCTYRGMPEKVSPVRNLLGCNMSFKKSVFDRIGGFRLGYGCDETEFCIRVGREWPQDRLVYNPSVRVDHRVPRERMSLRYFISRCYFEGGSKAVVTWLVGSERGLASERQYTINTLPRGVVRGVRRPDPARYERIGTEWRHHARFLVDDGWISRGKGLHCRVCSETWMD